MSTALSIDIAYGYSARAGGSPATRLKCCRPPPKNSAGTLAAAPPQSLRRSASIPACAQAQPQRVCSERANSAESSPIAMFTGIPEREPAFAAAPVGRHEPAAATMHPRMGGRPPRATARARARSVDAFAARRWGELDWELGSRPCWGERWASRRAPFADC